MWLEIITSRDSKRTFFRLYLGFRGPGRRSLGAKSQKVSKKSRESLPGPGPGAPKVRKKSRKRSEKSPKSLKAGFWRLFGPSSRLFSDFGDSGAGRPRETFSRLFGDFLETRPETPSPRSTESQDYILKIVSKEPRCGPRTPDLSEPLRAPRVRDPLREAPQKPFRSSISPSQSL